MMHERPVETAVEDRSEIEARKAITFQLDARRHPQYVGQFALRAKRSQVTFRRRVSVGARAYQRRSRLESPDLAAAMGGEIGTGRRRVGIAARAYERCTDLRVPERWWFGGRCLR